VAGLAYVALAYVIASAYYLAETADYGTPFAASLTPEQRVLKRASAAKRGGAFARGLVLAAAALCATRPLARA
jgi:hypothetical protein